jgi:hypothetical protein
MQRPEEARMPMQIPEEARLHMQRPEEARLHVQRPEEAPLPLQTTEIPRCMGTALVVYVPAAGQLATSRTTCSEHLLTEV